jgi:diguanylate cyclase (GGDEF)-like protein
MKLQSLLERVNRLFARARRPDGLEEPIPAIPLRELLRFGEPSGGIERAIHKAQLDALVRLVPGTLLCQFMASALLVVACSDSVPQSWLLTWFGAMTLLCLSRGTRAIRLLVSRSYAKRRPPSVPVIMTIVSILSALWLVPPLFFFDVADISDKILMLIVAVGLLSGGSYMMATVPLVALTFVWSLAAGTIFMTLHFHERWLTSLMPVYAGIMTVAVISHAREFVRHVRGRLQLQEQGELLSLLQELQASGSGGLWELDRDLKVTNISHSLAASIRMPVAKILGLPAQRLLDPHGRIADISTGMRTLFDHFEKGIEFRDIAIPAESGNWWSLSGKPVFANNGAISGWRGVASDVTALRLAGDDAVRTARIDPLTGVANRLLVRELLEEALLGHIGRSGECALLLVDLDRFELVNDTLGHAVGDQLLCEVARRLEATAAGGGRVGRLGGDEFAIVWTGPSDLDSLAALAGEVIESLTKSFSIGVATMHVGATIGIARGGRDGGRHEQLLRSADLALYRAKEEGRGGFAFFDHSMFIAAEDLRSIESDVREALDSGALRLVYQPIVDAGTEQPVGCEALLRWRHPTRGDIPPHRFVPIIEDAGLIHRIGDWVIRGACAEAASWDEPLRIAVNVSAAQLGGSGLAQTVVSALAMTGLDPDRLELEVTESVFLGDDAATLASLERLRTIGVRLVLDDFGKGYSSFGYLARARFSKIKIDQTFVRGAAQGAQESVAIVHAILARARGLGVETTAEGIETPGQAEVMRDLGCTQLQGFHFGHPVSAEERRRVMQTQRNAQRRRA